VQWQISKLKKTVESLKEEIERLKAAQSRQDLKAGQSSTPSKYAAAKTNSRPDPHSTRHWPESSCITIDSSDTENQAPNEFDDILMRDALDADGFVAAQGHWTEPVAVDAYADPITQRPSSSRTSKPDSAKERAVAHLRGQLRKSTSSNLPFQLDSKGRPLGKLATGPKRSIRGVC
jgi:hypothetical protein